MTGDRFQRSIYVSLGLHAFIVACVFLRAVVVPDQPIAIRNAIHVDLVGLPDKLPEMPRAPQPTAPKPEPAKAAPEPAPKIKPEPAPKPVPPKAPTVPTKKADLAKSQRDALAKLKRANALEEIEQEVAKQKAASAAAAAGKTAPVKGHQVSEGDSLTGLERLDYDRYFGDVKAKLFANYNLPQWLADAPLKASIIVLIDERGFVTRKTVRRSSGNDVFDAKALEAVDASSPFPPPPARLRGLLSTNGFVFNFPEQ